MELGERRLATIVVIDVAGYSRMMADDEDGTLATLRAHTNVIGPIVLNHGGRLVKSTGDGFLLEFPTAISAVEASLEIQEFMTARNAELPTSRRMELRIGANLGDVIVDESGDVFGDGVNVAARIEGLAEPGGLAVSDAVASAIGGRISATLVDDGLHELKNIPRPVRVWKTAPNAVSSTPLRSVTTTRKLATLAVLPFDNLSGDQEQEYFSDGITEDLITALSRDREIAVVARNSTFAFKGSPVDVRTIARELDATHVIEGSVRKAGSRVRITTQLIDAESGHHVWAERYDRELHDIFDLQDEVVEEIVTRLRPALWAPSSTSRRTHGPAALDAWDLTMQGVFHARSSTIDGYLTAIDFYGRARERDPEFVPAIAREGATWFTLAIFGWRHETIRPFDRGLRDIELALQLDPDHHVALCARGAFFGVFEQKPAEGVRACRRAIEIDPHDPFGYHMLGSNLDKTGDRKGAIAALTDAWRLAKDYPFRFDIAMDLGFAHYMDGNDEAALQWGRQSVRLHDEFLQSRMLMAATCARLGMSAEAGEHAGEVLRIRPDFSCSRFAERFGYVDACDRERFVEGLRMAGLPD
jgi:adenylate cyclase